MRQAKVRIAEAILRKLVVRVLRVAERPKARARSAKSPHFRAPAALSGRNESERQGAVAT